MFRTVTSILICFLFSVTSFAQLPPDFVDIVVTDGLDRPVAFDMDELGQSYILDKSGLVHVVTAEGALLAQPILDLSEEVGNWGDHGAIGIVLHPNFTNNGFIYISYVVDRHHLLHFGTPSYVADSTAGFQATIGRVTRYTLDENQSFQKVIPDSRHILIGQTKENGFPILMASHGIGDLVFGEDGTLFVSCGDAGSFLEADFGDASDTYHEQAIMDGILRADENLGAFRAQYVNSLCGKIIRIDPITGEGISSNPFYDPAEPHAPASKVWALGLRNPFRLCLKPNTGFHDPAQGRPGTLYIADVGANKWEELNIAAEPGQNFGWPMFEGLREKTPFFETGRKNPSARNPMFGTNCDEEFLNFQDLFQQDAADNNTVRFVNPCNDTELLPPGIPTFVHTPPVIAWANKLSNPPRKAEVRFYDSSGKAQVANTTDIDSPVEADPFWGFSSVAGTFYDGDNFPEEYRGKYFHGDYEWWIRVFEMDEQDQLKKVRSFHDNSPYMLDLHVGPLDGFLYYINFHNELRRIEFGGNARPIIKISVSESYGPAPLEVTLSAEGSEDPDGEIITYKWEFGDGFSSDLMTVDHEFKNDTGEPETFEVMLTATDDEGATSTGSHLISINNSPPIAEINSVVDSSYYALNGTNVIDLRAEVFDAESPTEDLSFEWQTFLQHNTHEHQEAVNTNPVTRTILEPAGCNGEIYWYRITLKVTDPQMLTAYDTIDLFPNCTESFAPIVDLIARPTDSTIQILWETFDESNLKEWEVQRINDFPNRTIIEKIEAEGNPFDYKISDSNPEMGPNYYRIKMIKENGIYEFSEVVNASFPPEPLIQINPNPASDYFEVHLREATGRVVFQLYSSDGKLALEDQWDALETRSINVQDLTAGTYIYQIICGTKKIRR